MTKSYKDWLSLDIENIEPLELSSQQKAKLKQRVFKQTVKKTCTKMGTSFISCGNHWHRHRNNCSNCFSDSCFTNSIYEKHS